ncbi:hypothetical protein ACJW30_02G094700 [Castanea mollissima]
MSKENKAEEAEAALQDLLVNDQPPFDNRFAMLHLNGFNCHNYHQHQPCTTCGCLCSASNPMKRRSPASSSSFQDPLNTFSSDSEPKPKKLFQDPVLRRTVSDPDPFPSGSGFQAPNPNNSLSPEQHPRSTGTVNVIPATPSSNPGLPPLPPTLRRSVSDPNPSPAKTYSRSSSSGDVSVDLTKEDTPNSNSNSNSKKRLRRMKDCMREMSKWCEEVMREQEDPEEEEQEDTNVHAVTKNNSAQDLEESVFVERVGEEGLTVHFKCPCGKGYQILLSGRNCYYKLM